MLNIKNHTAKSCRHRRFTLIIRLLLCLILVAAIFPVFVKILFLGMPDQSTTFDCDDSVLFMYNRLSELNIKAVPFVGDLDKAGEKYNDITHIWLLVNIAGINIPLDWGTPLLDSQHFEGYPVTYEQLIEFVNQDRTNSSVPAATTSR